VWLALVTILLTNIIKFLILIVSFHAILVVSKVPKTLFTFNFQMELKQIVHFNILKYIVTGSMPSGNGCSIIV
jgi:ABC-type uncharacterized transport system fused permease/ATPase subunit